MAVAKPKTATKTATKTTQETPAASKLSMADIKSGSLVSQIRDETIEFYHDGAEYAVDTRIKTLPFIETESLLGRMNKGEDVTAEWISKALVDESGKLAFTQEQVEHNFVQGLAVAVFDKVYGADNIKKMMEKRFTQA